MDPLRKRFFGDARAAAHYVGPAVKLLGQVKEQMGFNKLSQLSRQVVLAGGVVLFASSVFGQDEIRVYVPPAPESAGATSVAERDTEPYLWIGARLLSDPALAEGQLTELHVCLWLPTSANDTKPRVLSNRFLFGEITGTEGYDEPPIPPGNSLLHFIPGPTGMIPVTVPRTAEQVYPLGPWPDFMPRPPEDDSDTGIAYDPDTGICLFADSRNRRAHPEVLSYATAKGGYPMPRPVGEGDDAPPWDVVFVGDPANRVGAKEGIALNANLAGQYMVKLMAVNDPSWPPADLTVEVRVICGTGVDRIDRTEVVSLASATDWQMGIVPYGWYNPTTSGEAFTRKFATESDGTYLQAHVWFDAANNGPNPHGPHWWQGAVDIAIAPPRHDADDAAVNDVRFSGPDEVRLPPDVAFPPAFLPGAYPDRLYFRPFTFNQALEHRESFPFFSPLVDVPPYHATPAPNGLA